MNFTSVLLLCIAGCSLTSATCSNSSTHLIIEELNPFIPRCNGEFNPEKILSGPIYQLGNYRECLYKLEAQYCLTQIQLIPADNSSHLWQRIQESNRILTNFRRDRLYVGICVPTQCNILDIRNGLQESFNASSQDLGITSIITVKKEDCQTKNMLPLTFIDIIVCFLLGSIVLLVLCGSSYDAVRRKHKCENQVKTTGGRLLMCFSLFTNFHKLGTLSKTEDSKSFRFIQGIRFLTMFLVVTTHGLFWTIRGPIQNPEWVEESYKDFFRSGFMNGNAIMGTYLSISGFLLSYFFMQDKHVKGSFSMFDFLRVIGHRYMRLTPVYAIMVALAASWFNHLGSGPMWNHIVSTETEDCRQNWWYNLLYINNYINADKSCLGQTWYLAVDFQCFIMSMLVLILLCKYPQFDKIILGAVMLLWILVPFLQTYIERLDPMVINYPDTLTNLQQNRTFQRMYVPFHGNAGAYFVGVIFGYIYYNAKCNAVKRTRLMYVLVWSISLTVPWTFFMLSFIFYQPSYKYNVLSASFYACAYKTLFGTGIAVLVTGFALGYGWICNSIVSWKPFQVLGRLTYTIYFTHFSLQRLQAGATKEPVYLDEYSLFRSTLSDMIIAVGLALLLCLCIEMPFSAITTVFILPDLKVRTAPHKKVNNKGIHLQAAADGKEVTTVKLLDGNENHNSTNNSTSSHL